MDATITISLTEAEIKEVLFQHLRNNGYDIPNKDAIYLRYNSYNCTHSAGAEYKRSSNGNNPDIH